MPPSPADCWELANLRNAAGMWEKGFEGSKAVAQLAGTHRALSLLSDVSPVLALGLRDTHCPSLHFLIISQASFPQLQVLPGNPHPIQAGSWPCSGTDFIPVCLGM